MQMYSQYWCVRYNLITLRFLSNAKYILDDVQKSWCKIWIYVDKIAHVKFSFIAKRKSIKLGANCETGPVLYIISVYNMKN